MLEPVETLSGRSVHLEEARVWVFKQFNGAGRRAGTVLPSDLLARPLDRFTAATALGLESEGLAP